LMMVAAPLLVLGSPILVATWALPPRARQWVNQRRWRWTTPWYLLWHPVTLLALYAVTLWIWHLPRLYHAALRNPWVHDGQHLAFLVTACLFWRVLIDPLTSRRLSLLTGSAYLFVTSLHASALGVFMALSPRVWYSDYEPTTAQWGLTALEDQQLAGLIMWMPACTLYAAVVAAVFAWWLTRLQARQARSHQRPQGAPL
jgi:putative membrane protein